jgi:hypothetical protein
MTELSPSAKIILAASAKANCLQEWDHVNDPLAIQVIQTGMDAMPVYIVRV